MLTKTALYATMASIVLLAASHGYAQNADSVKLELSTVAQGLHTGGIPLTGRVRADCSRGQQLGGALGLIVTNSPKVTPGGGRCDNNVIVIGSAWGANVPERPCASAVVRRPSGGWKGLIHRANFKFVSVTDGIVVCIMDGN